MILLKDIRDYVATLGIAEDEHCYMGILPEKKEKSIGTYPLKRAGKNKTPIGGEINRSFGTKQVSFLVHWNKSPTETEKEANELFCALRETKMQEVNGWMIKFIQIEKLEPIWIGMDSNGIYEYVIECEIYYDKERKDEE